MRCLLSLFVIVSMSVETWGNIDSLKQELGRSDLPDGRRVKIYLQLAKAYWGEQLDSAVAYTDHAYVLAKALNNPEDIAKALIRKGILLINTNQTAEAMGYLEQARQIATEHGYQAIASEVYGVIGRIQAGDKQPDSAFFYYNKSMEIAEELGLKEQVLHNKIRISLILLHQKRHEELAALYNTIIPELEEANYYDGLIEIYTYMSLGFRDLDKKEKSLLYAEKALGLANKVTDKKLKALVFGAIGGGVTGYFESFERAEPILRKSVELATAINDPELIRTNRKRLAILHFNNANYEQSALIIDSLLEGSADPDVFKTKGMVLSYHDKKYAEAIKFYEKAYPFYEQDKAYIQQKAILQLKIDNRLALLGDEAFTRDFETLDSLTAMIHDVESKSQFFDLETKYRTAEKETALQRKELELAQSNNRILLVSGITLVLLGGGASGIWFMRNRQRRKELEHANLILELQHNLDATELANLNSQLNPHEIKNLITSIAPELIATAPEAYKTMIKLFNVTRASLSNKLTEPLPVQLQQIDNFLYLQQIISPYQWGFEIENEAGDLDVELPRLLLKNMVENAVKHGMKSVRENGMIRVVVSADNTYLRVRIKDNGVGLTAEKDMHGTGIGFSTYQKLFGFLNTRNDLKASLELRRIDRWTRTEISIPLNYQYK